MWEYFLFTEKLAILNLTNGLGIMPVMSLCICICISIFLKPSKANFIKILLIMFISWSVMEIVVMVAFSGAVSLFFSVQFSALKLTPILFFGMIGLILGAVFNILIKKKD